MSNKNRRITDWEINSNLDDEEIAKVKDTAAEIYRDIKNNKLSYYQALQVLELTKAVIGEESFN